MLKNTNVNIKTQLWIFSGLVAQIRILFCCDSSLLFIGFHSSAPARTSASSNGKQQQQCFVRPNQETEFLLSHCSKKSCSEPYIASKTLEQFDFTLKWKFFEV